MKTLLDYANEYGLAVTDETAGQFDLYTRLMLDYNKKVNLTAIVEPEEITVKHYLDSLLPLLAVNLPIGASLIDVGTGAGFPGVPLKIARADLSLTLLDSLNKRIVFLKELSVALLQENAFIHGRAEQSGHDPTLRERFDFAVSRAVAPLPALCEYCLPFVKPGGIFIALKGPDVKDELSSAGGAIHVLGGELIGIRCFDLPFGYRRTIILIKKRSRTLPKYPRTSVKITKSPL